MSRFFDIQDEWNAVASGVKKSGDIQDEWNAAASGMKKSGDIQDEWNAVASGVKKSGYVQGVDLGRAWNTKAGLISHKFV